MKMRQIIILVAILLGQLAGCSDMNKENEKTLEIETPSGTVVTDTKTVPHFEQKIQPVSGDALVELRSLDDASKEFLYSYVPGGTPPTLESYDMAFEHWQGSQSPKYTQEQTIEILGGVLGNYCIDNLNMEWVVVTHEYGTDYAVRHKKSEIMAFPFSSVLKRIERHESGFMDGVFETIKYTIQKGEARPIAPNRKDEH